MPPSFDTLAAAAKENEEAKSMIELGYFHAIGKSLIQSYRENKLPLPDPAKPLDAFFDTRPDYNPLLNTDMVVTLSERMQLLESFVETIPEQFCAPNIMVLDENKSFKNKTIKNVKNDATSSANSETAHEMVHDPRASYDGLDSSPMDAKVGEPVKFLGWDNVLYN